jgi:hypothetical protein
MDGHWYCENCEDVVYMGYEKVHTSNVLCPRCGQFACNFIPKKLSLHKIAPSLFDEMRRVVAEAQTAELFDQRMHKEIL